MMEKINYQLFKAFNDSFYETLKSMTALKVDRLLSGQDVESEYPQLQTMIAFGGGVEGFWRLKSSVASLLRLYEHYLGEKAEVLTEEVLDSIKELAGVIGGSASAKEQQLKLQFSPVVISVSEDIYAPLLAKESAASVNYYVDKCGVFTVEVHQREHE